VILHEVDPLNRWWINDANIQIISGQTKHHSKQVWISAYMDDLLTFRSFLTFHKIIFIFIKQFPHNQTKMKKLFSTRYNDNGISFAILLLRITAGGLMIVHGFDKLEHFSKYANGFADPFHIGSQVTLSLAVFAEFFCAALVVGGLLTRLATIPLIIDMAVAIAYAHHYKVTGPGELATLFLCAFIVILFTGPGKASLDRLIGK
jgi:putative oxidoreductase